MSGWDEEGSAPCDLQPAVALPRPRQPPRAEECGPLSVLLPSEERTSLRQSLPL